MRCVLDLSFFVRDIAEWSPTSIIVQETEHENNNYNLTNTRIYTLHPTARKRGFIPRRPCRSHE